MPQPQAQEACLPGNAQFQIDGGIVFEVGSAGIRLFPLAAGSHTIVEVATGASASFTVATENITTIVVYNFPSATPTNTPAPTNTPVNPVEDLTLNSIGEPGVQLPKIYLPLVFK